MNNILSLGRRVPGAARFAGAVGALGVAATMSLAGVASASATADLTVNPTALKTGPNTVVVSGTYRCTPTPGANMGQIAATLRQPGQAPGGATYGGGGVVNVLCDGTTHTYSINTFGSTVVGSANYHVVLNAVPTRENIVQDGVLTVL